MAIYGSVGRSGPRAGVSFRARRPIQFFPDKWDGENKFLLILFFGFFGVGYLLQYLGLM